MRVMVDPFSGARYNCCRALAGSLSRAAKTMLSGAVSALLPLVGRGADEGKVKPQTTMAASAALNTKRAPARHLPTGPSRRPVLCLADLQAPRGHAETRE